jgi:hypothetical protein
MPDVRALAAAYGVRVELTPLGDWGSARLISEYDPDGPTIRVNTRTLPSRIPDATLTLRQAQDDAKGQDDDVAIDRAIAHELYHHCEAIGEVERIAGRNAREAAADAFAERLIGVPA